MIFIFPFQNLYLHNNFCQKIVFNNTENRSNFRRFFAFLPPPLTFQKIKLLKKWKKAWRYYNFTRTINDNHMMYWDIECDRQNILLFWSFFCPFPPPPPPNNSEKKETWRYYHMCTINNNHMMYGSWEMECDRQFWIILDHFFALLTWRSKILKKWS